MTGNCLKRYELSAFLVDTDDLSDINWRKETAEESEQVILTFKLQKKHFLTFKLEKKVNKFFLHFAFLLVKKGKMLKTLVSSV